LINVLMIAEEKKFVPGKSVLLHCGNDEGERASMILGYQS